MTSRLHTIENAGLQPRCGLEQKKVSPQFLPYLSF